MSNPTKNRLLPPERGIDSPAGAVSTGSLALDLKLGTGGWPRGHIVEVYGAPGSGKTTLLLEAIAHAQNSGGFGAFIDADHGVTARAAQRLGVNLETMPFHRTNSLDEAFEKIDELARGGAVDVIALDGIAALLENDKHGCSRNDVPPAKDEEHRHRIDYCLRALLGPLSRSRAALLISNRIVEKVGVFFGSPETTPWPTLPLRDYASLRVELQRLAAIKDGDAAVGSTLRAKVIKSRLAAPFVTAELQLYFATGICMESDLLSLGLEAAVLSKRGNRIFFADHPLGAGWNDAVRRLRQDAALAAQLRDGILAQMRPAP